MNLLNQVAANDIPRCAPDKTGAAPTAQHTKLYLVREHMPKNSRGHTCMLRGSRTTHADVRARSSDLQPANVQREHVTNLTVVEWKGTKEGQVDCGTTW